MSKSNVSKRKHLPLSPKPMYVDNSQGHKDLEEMGLPVQSMRLKSKLNVDDVSNESGKRSRGGY